MGSQCKARRRRLAPCQARSRNAAMGAQWPEPLRVASKRPRYGVALLAKGDGHWRRRAPCIEAVWTQRDPPEEMSPDPRAYLRLPRDDQGVCQVVPCSAKIRATVPSCCSSAMALPKPLARLSLSALTAIPTAQPLI